MSYLFQVKQKDTNALLFCDIWQFLFFLIFKCPMALQRVDHTPQTVSVKQDSTCKSTMVSVNQVFFFIILTYFFFIIILHLSLPILQPKYQNVLPSCHTGQISGQLLINETIIQCMVWKLTSYFKILICCFVLFCFSHLFLLIGG